MYGPEFYEDIGPSYHDAQEIAAEAQKIIAAGALSDNYNVFIFDDHVALEPVVGSLGAGEPAEPERYRDYFLNVPLAYLETPEDVIEFLS